MKKILLFLFLAIIGSVIYLRGSEKVPVFNGEKIYAFDLDMGKVKKVDEYIDIINLGEIATENRTEDIDQLTDGKFLPKAILILNEDNSIKEIEKFNEPSEEEIKRLVEMKEIFFKIFPKDWAKNVVEFRGFVNNPGMGGYITTLEGNNDLQYFAINVDEGLFRTIKGKIYFLTHEFAHSFSLNSNQFDYSCKLEKVNCFYDDSYLKEYYNLFWKDGFPENWQDNEMKKPKVFEKFYNANRDIFVSSYAANNMYEDFAETFVFFVLNKFPEGNDVKSYKIKYFYSKPELLELKKTILENMI